VNLRVAETVGAAYHRSVVTTLRKWRSQPPSTAESVASSERSWRDPRLFVPLGAGAVYLVVVAVRLPSILSSFCWYGDFPAALRLGDAVFHGGWGQGLQLRDQAGLGPLWVVGLLNQVTGGATASMALGGAVTVLSVGFMVTTARRIMSGQCRSRMTLAKRALTGWYLDG
jgi:hypothetical protein